MNATQPLELTPEHQEKLRARFAAVEDLAARYEQDPGLRDRIDSGDVGDLLAGLGIALPAGVKAKIVANDTDTFHVVFPPNPNTALSDEVLNAVGGGNTADSACSASTVNSYSSLGSFGTGIG